MRDRHGCPGVTSWGRPGDFKTLEVCMRREKTIGKPCARNPHARFDERECGNGAWCS